MSRIVIGLAGRAGSGKSTAAKILVGIANRLGRPFSVIPFAGPLKRMAVILGWNGDKDDRGRRLLQDLGQTARAYDPDTWVKLWRNSVPTIDNAFVLADDVRFDNEAQEILDMGGRVLEITGRAMELSATAAADVSERGITRSLISHTIDNSGTVDQLDSHLRRVFQEMLVSPMNRP